MAMPKPRKRNSLLALAFKPLKYWQGYRSNYNTYERYYLRVEQNNLIRYYPAEDELELIPIKEVTLEDLGLLRLPSGKIIPKWNGR